MYSTAACCSLAIFSNVGHFCTNPVANILPFRSSLHSLSLLCNISAYFSVKQPTKVIDVTSCFGTFNVKPKERMHGVKFNLDSTQVCVYITPSKIQPGLNPPSEKGWLNLGRIQVGSVYSTKFLTQVNLG